MDFILVGPGRAGLAVALRLVDSGHHACGVLGRRVDVAGTAAERLGTQRLEWDQPLPPADLMILAVRDDAIGEVAERLAPLSPAVAGVVHLSGLTPTSVLDGFSDQMIGSFHPLQTMPDPETGARRLEGAWVAVTAPEDYFADRLLSLAASAGMRGFELDDDAKAVYHAAAAAAANFPLAAWAMSRRLFDAAGVPFEAAGPLIRAIVDNALSLGPEAALTGPIARGDVGTVRAQLAAVAAAEPALLADFIALSKATARVAGTEPQMAEAFD